MLEKIKNNKSYIIIGIIVILVVGVFVLKQINGDIESDCIDPNCTEHNHSHGHENIEEVHEYTIYNFTSNFCYYCTQMNPIFDKLKKEYKDKTGFKVIDIDKDGAVANKYNIYATPTFIAVDKDGNKKDSIQGVVSEEKLKEFIEKWSNK
ncbi:MAG: thioredoxin family protein [Clostridia bacterium]